MALPKTVTILLTILNIVLFSSAGVMHSHTNELHKEREADGAYSPRDHSHYDDSGEHNNEFDHEAILGSHKDAEEYDHLSPDEAKRRLGILLHKMDLNADNQIDKQELKAWILRSFRMLSIEEANERLEDADEDNNGIITWNEYLSDAYGAEEDNLSIGDENEHLVRDDKELWEAADLNKDSMLDSNEWVAFSHPEEHPTMLPVLLAQTLREKDRNQDGAIDFLEFVGDRGQEHDSDWLRVEKEKFDGELDKDNNGKLVGNEILSWVLPSNEDIAEEEVEHLFASSDDNHDQQLSFDEVLDHHDTFVGSEVTDYGDHLHNIHHFEDEL